MNYLIFISENPIHSPSPHRSESHTYVYPLILTTFSHSTHSLAKKSPDYFLSTSFVA